jgi:hypothetical protein
MLSSLALVVIIVIDQFRADELLRAQKNFNPAGIGRLVNKGLFYDDAHHTQFFNMTCPGHTAISTGAAPGLHGIVLNNDWDSESKKKIYCVADSEHKWIDADLDNEDPNIGTSAKRILTSTVGDEAKLIWGDENKVISVSIKDRAAIALGGHTADGAYWYAPKSQKWTTSDAYDHSRHLPQWLLDFNKARPNKVKFQEDEYESSGQSIRDLTDVVLASAKAEKLGRHPHADLLFVSYSTHDYVAHHTGDNSEALKVTLKSEDENIARMLTSLEHSLGGKKLLVVLTGDHGAGVDIDSIQKKYSISGGKQDDRAVLARVNKCLGGGVQVVQNINLNFYLAPETKDKLGARQKVKECVVKETGVWSAFTRDEILSNQVPNTPWLKNLTSSYNPGRGSDVIGILKPYWNSHGGEPIGHETPYDYDSWVPLVVWWQGIPHKEIHRRVEITSIAPTLARILKTRRPNGATSDYLTEVLDFAGH